MLGLMRVSTHQRVLDTTIACQRDIHNDLMDQYTSQVDVQMLRLRQAQTGEVERLRKQIDRLEQTGGQS